MALIDTGMADVERSPMGAHERSGPPAAISVEAWGIQAHVKAHPCSLPEVWRGIPFHGSFFLTVPLAVTATAESSDFLQVFDFQGVLIILIFNTLH